MKKTANLLALSTILLGALSPTAQVIAETIPMENGTQNVVQSEPSTSIDTKNTEDTQKTSIKESSEMSQKESINNQISTSDTVPSSQPKLDPKNEDGLSKIINNTQHAVLSPQTDGPSKVIEGTPERKVYLQANKVIIENEFTNGDEIHLGGQYNDTFNFSTIFYPSDYPAENVGAKGEKDGVAGLKGLGSAPAIVLSYTAGLFSSGDLIDIANSSFQVKSNGIDYTDKFEMFDDAQSGFIGIRMKAYPSGYFFPVGTGLQVNFHFSFLDNYGSRDLGDMNAFRVTVNDYKPTTPNIAPTLTSGSGPVINGVRVFFGYAPEIKGVDDIEVPLNDPFDPMNKVTAVDKHDGDLTNSLKIISNDVDTSKVGTYTVSYEVTDSDNHVTTANRTVRVVTYPTIKATDKTVPINSDPSTVNWMEGVKATDPEEGDLTKQVTVDYSKVDFQKVGDYPATYSVTNSSQKTARTEAVVHIVDNQQSITGSDVTKYVGDAIPNVSEFKANATDKAGNSEEVTIDKSKVDMSKVGDYDVLLTTTDGQSKTVQVHVKDKQTAVNVHDSTIYVGDDWKAEDNFDSALDKDGNAVDFSKLTVDDSKKDTSKAGTFDVTYSYDGITSTAKVTVKDKQTAVNVHDSTIYVGDDWKAEDNFDSALDKDGNAVDFSKLTVDDSKKDTSKAGTFEVTYSYDGVTSTAKVTVKAHNAPIIPAPPKITTPSTHGSAPKAKGTQPTPKPKVSSKTLPKTGETAEWVLTGSGFSIVLLLIAYLLMKTKRHNK